MDVQILRPAVTQPARSVRRRLPCAGLALLAGCGILAGEYLPVAGGVFMAGAMLCAAAAVFERLRGFLIPAVILGFAALHVWQGRESAAARIAEELGSDPRVLPIRFRIDEAPEPSGEGERARWRMRATAEISDGLGWRTPFPVMIVWTGEPPRYGDWIVCDALLKNFEPPRNPGEFDAQRFYRLRGIYSEARVDAGFGFSVVGNDANPVMAFAIAARREITRILAIGIGGTPEYGVILAMTLGDTSGASDATAEAFREVGVFHLFSVSGLHVAMIAAMLWFTLGIFGLGRRRAAAVLIPCVFFYALVTGWSPPSVRAATMVAMVAGGLLFHRHPVPINSLCAAGLILLAANTSDLFNPGFQLSFIVVGAILILARPLSTALERLVAPDPFVPRQLLPKWRVLAWDLSVPTAGLLAVSLAAWLGSLPLIVGYFNLISPAAIPANLVIVPLAFLSLALAAGAISVGWLIPLVADLFNHTNYLVTSAIIGLVQIFAAVPAGHFYVGPPLPADTLVEITVMDSGAGGSAILRTHRGTWLVDGGDRYFGETILPRFLQSRGVNRIHGAMLTHGDSRHLSGLRQLAGRIAIDHAYETRAADRSPVRKRLASELAASGTTMHALSSGDRLDLSANVWIDVLHPPDGDDAVYADDEALVLLLHAGDARILFVSDSGQLTEFAVMNHSANSLRADVLVKGQHQTGISGTDEFLRAVAPRVIVQSVATRPESERLKSEWMNRVSADGIRVLPQSATGAVVIRVTRTEIAFEPFLQNAGIFPFTISISKP